MEMSMCALLTLGLCCVTHVSKWNTHALHMPNARSACTQSLRYSTGAALMRSHCAKAVTATNPAGPWYERAPCSSGTVAQNTSESAPRSSDCPTIVFTPAITCHAQRLALSHNLVFARTQKRVTKHTRRSNRQASGSGSVMVFYDNCRKCLMFHMIWQPGRRIVAQRYGDQICPPNTLPLSTAFKAWAATGSVQCASTFAVSLPDVSILL